MAAFTILKDIRMTVLYIIVVITCFIIVVTAAFINWNVNPGKPKTVATPPPPKPKHPAKFKTSVRLSMRTLIRWEQLQKKSFSLMDYSDEKDMEALLYCSVLCCNPNEKMYTLDEFRHTMQNEKLVRQMGQALSREATVMAQFRQEAKDGVANREVTPGYINDIVSTLIMDGMNASYAMNEMDLCDLPMFVEAYERKRKEQMISSRLWTYLGMLPHINAKKLKDGARDIYPFPWEEEEIREKAEKAIQEDSEKLEAFFEQGKNLIKQNYGG